MSGETPDLLDALAASIDRAKRRMSERRATVPHDCETCHDCIHDGRKCCGCYDGACCRE